MDKSFGGLGATPPRKNFWRCVAHWESCAQDIGNAILRLGFCCCHVS